MNIKILSKKEIIEEFISEEDYDDVMSNPDYYYLHDENGFDKETIDEIVKTFKIHFPNIVIDEENDFESLNILLDTPEKHILAFSIIFSLTNNK